MNKDNAKEFLPLVQALAEGKTLQLRYGSGWKDYGSNSDINFGFNPSEYRVKPERIKKKMWYHPSSDKTGLYPVSDSAFSNNHWTESGWKIVEVEFDAP